MKLYAFVHLLYPKKRHFTDHGVSVVRKITYIESKYSRIFYICFGVGDLVVNLGRNKTCFLRKLDCVSVFTNEVEN